MPSLDDLRAGLPQLKGLSDPEALTFIQKAYYPGRTTDELGAALGVEPPKPPGPSQFTSGLKRSFAELPGLAAGVGAYAADVVGADGARDSMLAYAKQKNDEVAQAHQADASSITDAWDGKVGWLDFLKNSAGYVAGQAMQSIATGGLGAVGAKMLARQGAKEIAEAAAAKAIAGGASEEAAKQASIKALSEASTKAMEIGGVAGAGAHNFGMELGSIYPDAVETAGGADKLDAGDKFRVFAAASLAAGVDTAGEAILASRVLKGSKAEGAGMLGRAAREVPAGMLREGGTEAVQTAIEHYGAGQPIADEKGLRDIIDSAGVGMVGGGLGGAAASLHARRRAAIDAEAHQKLATATNVGDMIAAATELTSTPLDMRADAPSAATVPPEGAISEVDQTPVQRVDALRTQLQDPQVREQIREKLGPDALGTLGYYATQATRSDIPAATAERMLGLAEMIVSRAVLQPIDTPAGSAPQQAIGARRQDLLGMEQGPALIGADTQPTGTLRVDSAGVAVPETGIDRANARQAGQQVADAQAAAAAEAASLGTQARKASAVNADPNIRRPAPPVLMPERRRTDGVELQPVEPTDPVAAYLERVSAVNTPQARAFVQDFKAGRITRQDVIRVMQSQDADPLTPSQRIEQAAAQAPKPADGIQPARVYRSRSAAFVESRKTGGTVEPVQGGFIVKEPSNVEPDVAGTAGLPPAAGDGRAPDAGRSVGDLGSQPVAGRGRMGDSSSAPVVGSGAADAARVGDQRNPTLRGQDATQAETQGTQAPAPAGRDATTPGAGVPDARGSGAVQATGLSTDPAGREASASPSTQAANSTSAKTEGAGEKIGEQRQDTAAREPADEGQRQAAEGRGDQGQAQAVEGERPREVQAPDGARSEAPRPGAAESELATDAGAGEPAGKAAKPDAGAKDAGARASRGDTRSALKWVRTAANAAGPEFYGRGVDLIALREFNTSDDFSEDALPMGHSVHVHKGARAYQFLIVGQDHSVMGLASLEVGADGKIEAIHDIEITDKRQGVGEQVVSSILANADGPVRIIDILDQSDAFWQKMGAGYKDHYGNATADWASYREKRADPRASEGKGSRTGQGLEAGRTATGADESRSGEQPTGRRDGAEPKGVDTKADRGNIAALLEGSSGVGLPVRLAEKYAKAYADAGLKDVNIARNRGELPEHLRAKLSGFGDDVRGAYFPGDDSIWVFTDKIDSPDELSFVVMHEAFHRGLGALIGDNAKRLLRQMYATNKKLRDRADSVARELKISKDEAIEEALADMAGEGDATKLRGWERLAKLITDWLNKVGEAVGIERKFSNKDIETFVSAMARAGINQDPVEQGKRDGFDPGSVKQDAGEVKASRDATGNDETGWQIPLPSKLDDMVYELQDKLIDTKKVVKAVKEKVKDLKDQWDPYLQEELYHGRAAKQTSDFLTQEVQPLLSEMARIGVTMQALEKYLHARHAEERNEQIAKINPDMPDGGSGMKTAEAKAYLAGLTEPVRARLDKIAAKVDAITNGTRQYLVDTGLEDKATVKAWSDAYAHYVPLQRADVDADGSMRGTGAGFSVKGSASKRAMGSSKDVENILANVMLQRERAITRAEKNRVAQALYGMAIQAPNKGFWMAVDPDANRRTPAEQKALEDELVSLGLNPLDAEAVYKEPKQRYVDASTGLVAERINPAIRSRDNVLSLRVEGKDRFVFFSEKDPRAVRMVTALKNLDAPQMGEVMGLAAKITRYFSAINTSFNPVFGVVNLIRDFQSALFNQSTTEIAGREKEVARHVPAALKGIMLALRARRNGETSDSSWAQLFEEYESAGGRTGYRDMYATAKDRANQLEKELKRASAGEGKGMASIRSAFGLLEDYNDTMENALRLSSYKVARDQGMSPEQAASLAKNLTVNFNRRGHLTSQIGALYAFFNASAQGTARLIETMKGPRGKKILAGGLLLGAVQALLYAAADFDDGQPPDFVRERNFVIPIGDGKYLAVPMPLGLHVLPSLTRVPMEWALGGFKHTGDKIASLVSLFADTFNPIGGAGLSMQTLAPTILDPIAAIAENKDFAGKPIAKEDFGNAQTPGFTRKRDSATPWAQWASYAMNWISGGTDFKPGLFSPTPDQIDYLIGQATGGVGREASKVFTVANSVYNGDELPSYKMPLVGRLYGDTNEGAAVAGTFYDNLKQMRLHAQEVKGLKEHGGSVSEYLADNPEARMAAAAVAAEKRVANLRKLRRAMVERDMTNEQLAVVDRRIKDDMERFNAMMKSARD